MTDPYSYVARRVPAAQQSEIVPFWTCCATEADRWDGGMSNGTPSDSAAAHAALAEDRLRGRAGVGTGHGAACLDVVLTELAAWVWDIPGHEPDAVGPILYFCDYGQEDAAMPLEAAARLVRVQ